MFTRRSILIAVGFYFLITALFNYSLLCNALFNCTRAYPSDGIITEFISEDSYEKLKIIENPFSFDQKLFYPFYTSYALSDPGSAHVPLYALFRAIVPSHNALLLVVFINLFLNYFVMFLLLRRLSMDFWVALLGGFVFGAMPFVSYRVLNHYTYTPLFLYPLFFLFSYALVLSQSRVQKFLLAVAIGLTGVYILLSNFYYFVSVVLAIAAILFYVLLYHRQEALRTFNKLIFYLFVSGFIFIFTLMPWIQSVIRDSFLYSDSEMQGFGGAWVLSSDLLNVFLPSQHNPIYTFLFSTLSNSGFFFQKLNTMFLSAYSKNAYAGLLLLITAVGSSIIWRKMPANTRKAVSIYGFCAGVFLFFSFGPFLQIFNRWFVEFEGVPVVLPMPFLLLHYLPGMETLRAPSRFVPMYIFFFVLAASYIWNHFLSGARIMRYKTMVIIAAFLLVFFDQMYVMPAPAEEYATHVPTALYEIIAKDSVPSTVLEIPFTVRDGFNYRGYVKAVTPMKGSFIHDKSIMGGYVARVAPEIFNYYDRLPFISYVSRAIDEGNIDSNTTAQSRKVVYAGSREELKNELDFLRVKYILLKQKQKYSAQVEKYLFAAGFQKISSDKVYTLYQRPLTTREHTSINLLHSPSPFYMGSTDADKKKTGYQVNRTAKFFVHNTKAKKNLKITTAVDHAQGIDIYINGNYSHTITLEKSKKTYTIPIDISEPGVQMLDFVLPKVDENSQITLYTIEVS